MCGRFTQRQPLNLLAQQFLFAIHEPLEMRPRYNIAPTQDVAIVRTDPQAQRELAFVRWGLIPSWSKDPKSGPPLINARAETVATKPSFRTAFRQRRCLVLADGFYEWQKTATGKQPHHIQLADGRPFAFAGLWERWQGGGGPVVESCTIITTTANQMMAELHERMPVILGTNDIGVWLDPAISEPEELVPLLEPFPADEMIAQPVSTHVNNVRNDDPECVEVEAG